MPSSLQVEITEPGRGVSFLGMEQTMLMLTVLHLPPVGWKVYFDLDRRNRHNLTRHIYAHVRMGGLVN